jgi:hypothetical protein
MKEPNNPVLTFSALLVVFGGSLSAAAATPDEAICFLTAGSLVKMETKGQMLYDPGAGHKVVTAIWESYRALTSSEEQRICVSRADNYPDSNRVLGYINQHPETKDRCAPEVVVRALEELYPCDADVRKRQLNEKLDNAEGTLSFGIEMYPPTVSGAALHNALQSDGDDRKLAVAYVAGRPRGSLLDGDVVLAEAFYYTTDNGERLSENFPDEPYVSVVMFDEDENPVVAFETSPDDFLSIVRLADSGALDPARELTLTAEQVPQGVRIYWDRDI